jgi:beta-mannosidase
VNHHPYNLLRKSAANFGWDWGIDVATSGIWQPIGIESWSAARIAGVRPLVDVQDGTGVLTAHVDVERAVQGSGPFEVVATVAGHEARTVLDAGAVSARLEVRVPDADLWWPVGHGAPALYEAGVTLRAGGDAVAAWSGRIGFRTVALDTSPDEDGNRFEIRVNGRPIAVRGMNWIPDHAFITEIGEDRYAARFDDALGANVNLLRIWGGGIYEAEAFYRLADERGVLVWQDFLFACAAYPEQAWLADEVEAEAREQVTRLSAHPSLIVWNGNNENTWGYVEWRWRPALGDRPWGDGYYRDLLPRIVAELDPTRPYTPASPYSFVDYAHPNDPRNGTVHVWDVWNELDYTAYRTWYPRFVSEFGFQGPPAWSTLSRVVHDEPRQPYGDQMLVHQKAADGNGKLERGLAAHLPAPSSIDDWHWATQLNQAHAIRFGVEHFRSLAPWNTGVVLWQLNDNWPVISWAAVDFDGHRKPLWWAVQAAYAPRLATFQPHPDGSGLALVLLNDTDEPIRTEIALRTLDLDGTVHATAEIEAEVGPRASASVTVPEKLAAFADPATGLLVAEAGGFARAVHYPAEPLGQRLRHDSLRATAEAVEGGVLVIVSADTVARDVFLQVDRVDPGATVDRGLVTLLPGESASFRVTTTAANPGAFLGPLVLRSLNDLIR